MTQIEVRPAQGQDRTVVLAFCAQTRQWGDYIEQNWEKWLHTPDGQLFVATADEQPVGLIHIQMLNPDEAWLQGLRVDPAYRQQGIARALSERGMLEAMQRGAIRIRLSTSSSNEVAIHLCESLSMHRIGSFTLYKASAAATPAQRSIQEQIQPASATDLDDIIDYLNSSNIFPLVGGLYYSDFIGYTITAELLEEQIVRQQVYLLRRWERLDGLAIVSKHKMSLGYIDGTTIESISLIAYGLRQRLTALGLEHIHVYTPDLVLVHDALGGIEYETEHETFHTYERSLE